MDAMGITQLVLALAVVAGALWGFNWLVGRGPRGMVWLLAASVFSLSSALPDFVSEYGSLTISARAEFIITVMQVCGFIGFCVGVFDVVQKRTSSEDENPIAKFFVWQPLVWCGVLYTSYYGLLYQGVFHSAWLIQYTAAHVIAKVEVTVFLVGLAAVVLRFCETVAQFPSLDQPLLDAVPAGGEPVSNCEHLLRQVSERVAIQNTWIVRRMHDALEFVRRKNSADELDAHLRHLEELEAVRANGAYSMIRIIIWAIPILGLLGTVIGITMAVANLDPQTLEESVSKVTHGLNVAFDHTATALSLTMLLMFSKSAIERIEDRVFGRIDERIAAELVGRFQASGASNDGDELGLERASGQIVAAIETLAGRQAEIWKTTIDGAHQQWADVSVGAARTLRDSFASAVKDGLDRHSMAINQGAQQHVERLMSTTAQHAEQLDRSAQNTSDRLREGLEKVAELLIEALERHGDVMTTSEKELAAENRQHLSEVEAALGSAMVGAAERQERLITQSESLLKEMQIALVEAAGATVAQQEQLIRQGDVLLKVVDATGQIVRLEESLAQNLSTVQKTHNFEEMAINLSAAIQLLSARLGHGYGIRSREVAGGDAASQAA